MMLQLGIAIVDVAAAGSVLALVLRRRHRLGTGEAVFCAADSGAIGALTLSTAAFGAPAWLVVTGCASFVVMLALWFRTALWAPRALTDYGEIPSPPGKDEPWWWPEFERDLRAYERSHRPRTATRPAPRRLTTRVSRRIHQLHLSPRAIRSGKRTGIGDG